jgi:hypothetical protein
MLRRFLSLSWLLAAAVSASAQTPLVKLGGDVVMLDGPNLELRSRGGETLAIRLSDHLRISARSPAGVGMIKQGAYVGTTAVAQPDGTLVASEVQVFPESMRGIGEGHRPMSPGSGAAAGTTMTNATVAGVAGGKAGNTMTNATVSSVAPGERALRMTLTYKGGEKIVVVPEGILMFMTEAADRGSLVPGAHVIAYVAKQPDGILLAERVSVGKNGYVPPR